jgi:hypothetical protein
VPTTSDETLESALGEIKGKEKKGILMGYPSVHVDNPVLGVRRLPVRLLYNHFLDTLKDRYEDGALVKSYRK